MDKASLSLYKTMLDKSFVVEDLSKQKDMPSCSIPIPQTSSRRTRS